MKNKERKIESLLSILKTILDQVDYTTGNCLPNEMVGAVLDRHIIERARRVIAYAENE